MLKFCSQYKPWC